MLKVFKQNKHRCNYRELKSFKILKTCNQVFKNPEVNSM